MWALLRKHASRHFENLSYGFVLQIEINILFAKNSIRRINAENTFIISICLINVEKFLNDDTNGTFFAESPPHLRQWSLQKN